LVVAFIVVAVVVSYRWGTYFSTHSLKKNAP